MDNLPPGAYGALMLAERDEALYERACERAEAEAATVLGTTVSTVVPEDDGGNSDDGWCFRASDGCRAVQIVVRSGSLGGLTAYAGDFYTHRLGDLLNPLDGDPFCVDEDEALAEALRRSANTSHPLAVWDITSDTPAICLVVHQERAYRHIAQPSI